MDSSNDMLASASMEISISKENYLNYRRSIAAVVVVATTTMLMHSHDCYSKCFES